jgi:predicted GIY-YIG superfamily endonuclease
MTAARRRRAWVYLLRCADGSLYAGAAFDVAARLARHESGRGARYTRSRLPVTLAFKRRCADWSAALREERRLKRLRKAEKEALVAAFAARAALSAVQAAARTRARRGARRSDA